MSQQFLETFGLYGATFVFCFVAAVVPIVINVELFLIGIVGWAVSSSAQLLPLIVLASLGQMAAKSIVYYAGLGAVELPRSAKAREKIARARRYVDRWQDRRYWYFSLSAVFGLPPFFLTCLAAGAMRIRFDLFFLLGLAGRLTRFTAIIVATWALRG